MGTLVSLEVMSFQGGAQFGYGNNPLIPPPSSSAPPPSHVSGPGPLGRDDEEVKLYSSSRERERIEALGDLYAIIQTVEVLEKAYIRDCDCRRVYACVLQADHAVQVCAQPAARRGP